MWTATLKQLEKQSGQLRAIIVFDNGTDSIVREFTFSTAPDLKQVAIDAIQQITALYNVAKTVSLGPIDLTPTPAPAPTQTELDKATFFANYTKLQDLKQAVDFKALDANSKDLADLEVLVKSQYKTEYFS